MTPAQNDYCEPSSRPPSVQSCTEAACQYVWVAGEWSQVGVCSFLLSQSFTKSDIAAVVDLLCFQCSASCGIGYQQRYISCSMIPSSPGLHAQTIISAGKCPEPHPPDTRPCVLQECASSAYWKVGPWSKVKPKTHPSHLEKSCSLDKVQIGVSADSWALFCVSVHRPAGLD